MFLQRVIKKLFGLTLAVALPFALAACTTIEINESDAFDNHRTVTPQSFSSEVFSLDEFYLSTSDGEELNTWLFTRPDAEATVVYFGGNGFLLVKAQPWIEAYENIPVNLLMFDYRGYGLSSGSPSVEGLMEDARTVYNWIAEETEDSSLPLLLHGHSMGSFLASRVASESEAAALILESPITNVDDWTGRLVPWLLKPFIRFRPDEAVGSQNNIERVREITIPALFIVGTDDQITPKEMAEKLYEESASTKKQLHLVEGGGHNDLPEDDQYPNLIYQFIREALDK